MAMAGAICPKVPITLGQHLWSRSRCFECCSSPSSSTSTSSFSTNVAGYSPTSLSGVVRSYLAQNSEIRTGEEAALSLGGRGLRIPRSFRLPRFDSGMAAGFRRRARSETRKVVSPSCSSGGHFSDEANVAELPCLPFSPSEVFVPASTKVLHLYEARFLALLEEVVGKYDNLFAHIVIEPMGSGNDDDSKGVTSFLATYGCLVRVEKVKRLEIGAEVTIRGIGRIKIIGLTQLEPFLKGTVISLKDEAQKDSEDLAHAIDGLRTSLSTVQQLQIKLKVSKTEILQTPLERALQWAEKGEPDEVAQVYLPSLEERISFAALQPVSGASAAEQHRLLQERLYAMEAMTTLQRLNRVQPFVQQVVASLAAKVSLQSLNL